MHMRDEGIIALLPQHIPGGQAARAYQESSLEVQSW